MAYADVREESQYKSAVSSIAGRQNQVLMQMRTETLGNEVTAA